MKILTSKLKPNPFRKIKKYPIDREKIAALKNSIRETTFWDNLVCRKVGDIYEIAYGHHRLVCLKELKIKEVDIPVRDLDDATMLRIMANENLEDWQASPAVINETVMTAREFLNGELAKYETLKILRSTDKSISSLFKDEHGFRRAKAGVGRETIKKFLGDNWSLGKVQKALDTLRDDEAGTVDREAVESFDRPETAKNFRQAVKTYKIPKSQQKPLAEKLAKKQVSKREVTVEVQKAAPKIHRQKKTKSKQDKEVEQILKRIYQIDEKARSLTSSVEKLSLEIQALGVTKVAGIQTALASGSLMQMFKSIEELYKICKVKKG